MVQSRHLLNTPSDLTRSESTLSSPAQVICTLATTTSPSTTYSPHPEEAALDSSSIGDDSMFVQALLQLSSERSSRSSSLPDPSLSISHNTTPTLPESPSVVPVAAGLEHVYSMHNSDTAADQFSGGSTLHSNPDFQFSKAASSGLMGPDSDPFLAQNSPTFTSALHSTDPHPFLFVQDVDDSTLSTYARNPFENIVVDSEECISLPTSVGLEGDYVETRTHTMVDTNIQGDMGQLSPLLQAKADFTSTDSLSLNPSNDSNAGDTKSLCESGLADSSSTIDEHSAGGGGLHESLASLALNTDGPTSSQPPKHTRSTRSRSRSDVTVARSQFKSSSTPPESETSSVSLSTPRKGHRKQAAVVELADLVKCAVNSAGVSMDDILSSKQGPMTRAAKRRAAAASLSPSKDLKCEEKQIGKKVSPGRKKRCITPANDFNEIPVSLPPPPASEDDVADVNQPSYSVTNDEQVTCEPAGRTQQDSVNVVIKKDDSGDVDMWLSSGSSGERQSSSRTNSRHASNESKPDCKLEMGTAAILDWEPIPKLSKKSAEATLKVEGQSQEKPGSSERGSHPLSTLSKKEGDHSSLFTIDTRPMGGDASKPNQRSPAQQYNRPATDFRESRGNVKREQPGPRDSYRPGFDEKKPRRPHVSSSSEPPRPRRLSPPPRPKPRPVHKPRDRTPSRERDRRRPHSRGRNPTPTSPPPSDSKRRQVYVNNLPYDISEKVLVHFMEQVGPVSSVVEYYSKKGAAIIMYRYSEHAAQAIKRLNNTIPPFAHQPVYVREERAQLQTSGSAQSLSEIDAQRTVVVTNLPSNIAFSEVRKLMRPAGSVLNVSRDTAAPQGRQEGGGSVAMRVVFKNWRSAQSAVNRFNDFRFRDRVIRVFPIAQVGQGGRPGSSREDTQAVKRPRSPDRRSADANKTKYPRYNPQGNHSQLHPGNINQRAQQPVDPTSQNMLTNLLGALAAGALPQQAMPPSSSYPGQMGHVGQGVNNFGQPGTQLNPVNPSLLALVAAMSGANAQPSPPSPSFNNLSALAQLLGQQPVQQQAGVGSPQNVVQNLFQMLQHQHAPATTQYPPAFQHAPSMNQSARQHPTMNNPVHQRASNAVRHQVPNPVPNIVVSAPPTGDKFQEMRSMLGMTSRQDTASHGAAMGAQSAHLPVPAMPLQPAQADLKSLMQSLAGSGGMSPQTSSRYITSESSSTTQAHTPPTSVGSEAPTQPAMMSSADISRLLAVLGAAPK